MIAGYCHHTVGDTLVIELDVEGMPAKTANKYIEDTKATFQEAFKGSTVLIVPMNKVRITVLGNR